MALLYEPKYVMNFSEKKMLQGAHWNLISQN